MDAEDFKLVETHSEEQGEEKAPLADETHEEHQQVWRHYKYKRVIVPERVVVGYLGDFGADVPYLSRQEMMRGVRASIRFCDRWLRTFVLSLQLPDTWRLRRNMTLRTRERRYYDLLEYERYLRWNVEYRFYKVALREICAALEQTKMPTEHILVVVSYLF